MAINLKPLTWLCFEWVIRAFGAEHANNVKLRSLRCAEEAVELAQAVGIPRHTMERVVQLVYDRPVGEVKQEVAGVLLTVITICAAFGQDPEDLMMEYMSKTFAKPIEQFRQRNQEKINQGLDA